MNSIKRSMMVMVLALAAAPVFAGNADLVHVTTSVSQPSANPGGANEGTVLIENNVNADVRVRLDLRVVYSDGRIQRLSGISDPGVLGPGGGFFLSVFFVIPADAPPGPANFVADVTASSGGLQEQETSRAGFQVVVP